MMKRRWQRLAPVALCAAFAVACGDDAGGSGGDESDSGGTTGGDAETTTPDDDTSSGSDGTSSGGTGGETGSAESSGTGEQAFDPDAYALSDVFGVPNLDDDDSSGSADWLELVFEDDDDVSVLDIPPAPEGWQLELSATGDLENFRLWDGETFAIGIANDDVAMTYTVEPGPEGTSMTVEFGEYGTIGGLDVRLLAPDGSEASTHAITLMGSPLIMNHHLQPAERVWVMDVDAQFGDNAAMVADYADALGDRFSTLDDATYGFDVWVQDEIELATASGDQGQRLNVIIDSVRDRGLDDFPEDEIVAPDFIAQSWGNPANATTWDSFGNLEASPPVTVDGVEYPFGRIYYGRNAGAGLGMQTELGDFLASQRLQEPFEVDTLWLCVGHVDEFSSFVPDPSSPKGFKMLFSDVDAAWEIIDALPPSTQLGRHGPDHGYYTAADLQDDAGLRALNAEIQADALDPIRQQFIDELGLEASDIILVPSLFEEIPDCGVAALIPGMVNLIVANPEDGPVDLFIPDPFFRANENDQSSDPFIEAFTQSMPDGLQLHYVDNWDVYHLALGEVHCGTNVQRTPLSEWWTAAMHLLETPR